MESKEYSKVLVHMKERCCYNPSEKSKERILGKIKRRKRKPLLYSGVSIATFFLLLFSVNFFTNNSILVQPKTSMPPLMSSFKEGSNNLNSELSLNLDKSDVEQASFNSLFGDKISSSFSFLNDDANGNLPNIVVDSVY
jgi:hypothetical protein